MRKLLLSVALLLCLNGRGMAQQYWNVDDAGNSITWQVKKGVEHQDHIEMAGKRVAVVLRYGVGENGEFVLNKSMVWPMLRTVPNNTHSSLMRRFDWNPLDGMTINGRSMQEEVQSMTLNGTLEVSSVIKLGRDNSLLLKRTYFPSVDKPALIEIYKFVNTGKKKVTIETAEMHNVVTTHPDKGVAGSYKIHLTSAPSQSLDLAPGESLEFTASISGYKTGEQPQSFDGDKELEMRRSVVDEWMGNLVLETPDPVINEMFAFSKIRACESIYETKGGPMHGPGGESYYAAIWANDQAEYINPYFPFVGYKYGNASAMNSFKHFARYMNDEWKPIPSSIIAEGDGYWNGAGDRGDAAMIAYGAARYALASGNKEEAKELWPLIKWCLEFSKRKINEKGVVASDRDELEGRFPAGKANLCTSSLYYDALLSSAYIAEQLGEKSLAKSYRRQAAELEKNMDAYFASNVEGFDTYAYYEGNDVLRAWICIPLTVGIHKRAEGTIEALFSPRLWTENGLLTQAGTKTFWDRSTLYALRGVFMAGETEKALEYMKRYSNTRLLGSHVPYAVEAWPEGGQRHLSAESGLYGRIVTEGIFGIRPTGFDSFTLTPRLPEEWNEMSLRRIRAFGSDFDIQVLRVNDKTLRVMITKNGKTLLNKKIKNGATLNCKLS
ncbi:hypothetical protein DWZ67_12750 [Bacteroides sp. AF34-31BH]|uniref:hypothetical protein n=1 Tax=Bacteroides sp. AF34-31BH TaxID=2292931 RepID=UPI000E70E02E|nr:hypothetical protein [Bacteroides sp. AF34-31BH]RJV04882.1 hypothetical protein DWZ67_12750 [Bacteroides sp. AF34-31BH]